MTTLFWIPFATGVFHSISKEQEKEKQWATTLSILGTTSLYSTLLSIREEYFLKPEHQKMIPSKLRLPGYIASSLFVSTVHTGAYFCLGHLLTKKAYPVLKEI